MQSVPQSVLCSQGHSASTICNSDKCDAPFAIMCIQQDCLCQKAHESHSCLGIGIPKFLQKLKKNTQRSLGKRLQVQEQITKIKNLIQKKVLINEKESLQKIVSINKDVQLHKMFMNKSYQLFTPKLAIEAINRFNNSSNQNTDQNISLKILDQFITSMIKSLQQIKQILQKKKQQSLDYVISEPPSRATSIISFQSIIQSNFYFDVKLSHKLFGLSSGNKQVLLRNNQQQNLLVALISPSIQEFKNEIIKIQLNTQVYSLNQNLYIGLFRKNAIANQGFIWKSKDAYCISTRQQCIIQTAQEPDKRNQTFDVICQGKNIKFQIQINPLKKTISLKNKQTGQNIALIHFNYINDDQLHVGIATIAHQNVSAKIGKVEQETIFDE